MLAIPKAALALWRPRFLGAAKGFVALERERRARHRPIAIWKYAAKLEIGRLHAHAASPTASTF